MTDQVKALKYFFKFPGPFVTFICIWIIRFFLTENWYRKLSFEIIFKNYLSSAQSLNFPAFRSLYLSETEKIFVKGIKSVPKKRTRKKRTMKGGESHGITKESSDGD
jgi:hypothetical protein